jgi:hypothetical protein
MSTGDSEQRLTVRVFIDPGNYKRLDSAQTMDFVR